MWDHIDGNKSCENFRAVTLLSGSLSLETRLYISKTGYLQASSLCSGQGSGELQNVYKYDILILWTYIEFSEN